jgi:hypothetical protein
MIQAIILTAPLITLINKASAMPEERGTVKYQRHKTEQALLFKLLKNITHSF